MHRKHLKHELIRTRYKHLVSMLMWSCCLSNTEAVSCIRMYLDGFMFASEAVNHMGGTLECVKHAAKCRNSFARIVGGCETYKGILKRADYYAVAA